MDQSKINLFIALNGQKFDSFQLQSMRRLLTDMDEDKYRQIISLSYKDPSTLLIISVFLGYLGVDRFMLGDIGLGILKLLTCGGLGIWTLIDWFFVQNLAKKYNYNLFIQTINRKDFIKDS